MAEPIDNIVFAVNKEPYCLWGHDLRKRNLQFLGDFDVEFFEYSIERHLEAEDEQRASIALHITLHHALETMFALVGAYVQAPLCAYAWISKYSNADLRNFVERINREDDAIYCMVNMDSVSWEAIAKAVFACYLPDTPKQAQTIQMFSTQWRRLATILLAEGERDQYNALKHGLRVQKGGFGIAYGLEPSPGVPAPPESMRSLGSSDFGMSFHKVRAVADGGITKENRSVCCEQHSHNWSVEQTILLIQMVSMSISNLVSSLKVLNGAEASTCKFVRPENNDGFDQAWAHGVGLTHASFNFVVDESNTRPVSKDQLIEYLSEATATEQT